MSTNTPKDSNIFKLRKPTREAAPPSTSNPAKLLKTPKLPMKLEFSQDQGTNDSFTQNGD